MTWAKVDDGMWCHPKFLTLSLAATGVWSRALSWCANNLTSGRIPKALPAAMGWPAELIEELVDATLWDVTDAGWAIHNYLEYNPSKEEVIASRSKSKERAARSYTKKQGARRYDSAPAELAQNTAKNSRRTRDFSTGPVPGPVSSSSVKSSPSTDTISSTKTSHPDACTREPMGKGDNDGVVVQLRDPAYIGYSWLSDSWFIGTGAPDVESWREEYVKIGSWSPAERERIAMHMAETPYLKAKRSKATPAHIVKFREQFLEGPRSFEYEQKQPAKRFAGPSKVGDHASYIAEAQRLAAGGDLPF